MILRDNGCDLGIKGRDIVDKILVHHMNPMDKSAIEKGHRNILDPQYLITTTHRTHNAIHYGDASLLLTEFKPRQVGDTRLW